MVRNFCWARSGQIRGHHCSPQLQRAGRQDAFGEPYFEVNYQFLIKKGSPRLINWEIWRVKRSLLIKEISTKMAVCARADG